MTGQDSSQRRHPAVRQDFYSAPVIANSVQTGNSCLVFTEFIEFLMDLWPILL